MLRRSAWSLEYLRAAWEDITSYDMRQQHPDYCAILACLLWACLTPRGKSQSIATLDQLPITYTQLSGITDYYKAYHRDYSRNTAPDLVNRLACILGKTSTWPVGGFKPADIAQFPAQYARLLYHLVEQNSPDIALDLLGADYFDDHWLGRVLGADEVDFAAHQAIAHAQAEYAELTRTTRPTAEAHNRSLRLLAFVEYRTIHEATNQKCMLPLWSRLGFTQADARYLYDQIQHRAH